MDYRLCKFVLLLALAGCTGQGGTPTASLAPTGCRISMAFEQMAADFRSLRITAGHFQGGPWNADVDAWGGRKQQTMIELGSRLGTGDCSRAQILDLLGPPDTIARQGDLYFDLVSRLPEFQKPAAGPYELLIYYWRGAHDFLYFTCQGEAILNSGWWYAYE